MRYVVDIGASQGLFTNYVAAIYRDKRNDQIQIFAVEPIPEVASRIESRKNIVVVVAAVLPDNRIPPTGIVRLNVLKNVELSSILHLNNGLDTKVWSEHLSGTEVERVIEVPAITLEQLMNSYKIPHIDFLKIDTQGTDLDVLESAGDKISAIKAVVMEFPYSADSALYESETHLRIALERVQSLGFSPVRIIPNGGGECNVFLRNTSLSLSDYFQIEDEMGLEKAPTLKIGPHDPALKPWLVRSIHNFADHVYKILQDRSTKHEVK
jgi:FkbM family methyltransferase